MRVVKSKLRAYNWPRNMRRAERRGDIFIYDSSRRAWLLKSKYFLFFPACVQYTLRSRDGRVLAIVALCKNMRLHNIDNLELRYMRNPESVTR